MNKKKQQVPSEAIPYLTDLVSFYQHIKASPPLHKDFDIREINPDIIRSYNYVSHPFRHSFYCITLYLEGDITLGNGFWKTNLNKPALYFKTPHQIFSWIKPDNWLKEYFLVFTESFLLKHKALADIAFNLPFFKMEKAIPFEIELPDVQLLTGLYQQILQEYRSNNADKMELIASYTHILLIHVRRLYEKYAATDQAVTLHINDHEKALVDKFRTLVQQQLSVTGSLEQARTVAYFASLLTTHPNHLNAVVKRQTGNTAITLIHEQIVHEAKSLLSQTDRPVKEISFQLGFNEPSHFNHFFKKLTGTTPAIFRKEGQLSFSHHSL